MNEHEKEELIRSRFQNTDDDLMSGEDFLAELDAKDKAVKKQNDKVASTSRSKMFRMAKTVRAVRIPLSKIK